MKTIENINSKDGCFDIGPETTMHYSQILSESETILWNGPLGVSENPYFGTGTQQICRIIEELSNNGVISILEVEIQLPQLKSSHNLILSLTFLQVGSSLELLSEKSYPHY